MRKRKGKKQLSLKQFSSNPLGNVAKGKAREIIGTRNDAMKFIKGKIKV